MTTFRVNENIIRKFCETRMSTHTDWTGTRVETKYECHSVEEFIQQLMNYIEDNQF